jgi:hypothetical protein
MTPFHALMPPKAFFKRTQRTHRTMHPQRRSDSHRVPQSEFLAKPRELLVEQVLSLTMHASLSHVTIPQQEFLGWKWELLVES